MRVAPPAVVARVRALLAKPEEADELVSRWLRRFTAVSDRRLRRTVLLEGLTALDDGSLLGVLHRVERRAEGGDAVYRWLNTELALTPSILQDIPYDRTVDLYAAAREAGEERLAARFLGDRVDPEPPPPRNPHLDISPGERTAAARGRDRLVLDRLLHDRDLRVIRALLDNPRITERDVVSISAMRRTLPEILTYVAAHPRWCTRYRVRKALAFNPCSPTSLARQLLPTLLRQHLVELADSNVLAVELRETVRGLLGSEG